MICWRCHSNNVNTGSRLPICSDVKKSKRRKVVGIDMIRNNRIAIRSWPRRFFVMSMWRTWKQINIQTTIISSSNIHHLRLYCWIELFPFFILMAKIIGVYLFFQHVVIVSNAIINTAIILTLYIIYLIFSLIFQRNCHMCNISSIKESWLPHPLFK